MRCFCHDFLGGREGERGSPRGKRDSARHHHRITSHTSTHFTLFAEFSVDILQGGGRPKIWDHVPGQDGSDRCAAGERMGSADAVRPVAGAGGREGGTDVGGDGEANDEQKKEREGGEEGRTVG